MEVGADLGRQHPDVFNAFGADCRCVLQCKPGGISRPVFLKTAQILHLITLIAVLSSIIC